METHAHLPIPPKPHTCPLPLSHTHTHSNTEDPAGWRVCLSSALVPGFPDRWCVVGWSMWGLSGVERANGQVSGSDTSWLPLPITATPVNRLHHTPLLLTHKCRDTWPVWRGKSKGLKHIAEQANSQTDPWVAVRPMSLSLVTNKGEKTHLFSLFCFEVCPQPVFTAKLWSYTIWCGMCMYVNKGRGR